MEHISKLKPIEAAALRLVLAGDSETEAQMETHPEASRQSAAANAYKFFKRAREKLTDKERLELYNLGTDRLLSCLNEMLTAEYDIVYQGNITGRAADNYSRLRAMDMLAKIQGIYKQPETTDDPEPLNIVFSGRCLTREDLEADPNVEIFDGGKKSN